MNAPIAPLRVIGYVESRLVDPMKAPRQPDELGAPTAVLRIEADYVSALAGLNVGDEIVVVTWLHLADRHTVTVHPRNDNRRARIGVFATRSADRPNPIGLHRTTITDIAPPIITIANFEAVDGTPILDIKPVLGPPSWR